MAGDPLGSHSQGCTRRRGPEKKMAYLWTDAHEARPSPVGSPPGGRISHYSVGIIGIDLWTMVRYNGDHSTFRRRLDVWTRPNSDDLELDLFFEERG